MAEQSVNEPEPVSRRMVPLALRNLTILVVAFCFGVAGAANSDRVPGDPFYSAKRAAETPAQIVDRDIVASNRIGELAVLIERGADPEIVLTARTEAARAVLDRRSDDPMFQALSLLAWPGVLAGPGIDLASSPEGLLITEADWTADEGYTASLTDGHLVKIFSADGDVLIGTTGNWTVFTTASGWQLLNDDVNQVYTLRREGNGFRVSTVVAAADPSEGEEAFADGPNQTFQQSSLTATDDEPDAGDLSDDASGGSGRSGGAAEPPARATTVVVEPTGPTPTVAPPATAASTTTTVDQPDAEPPVDAADVTATTSPPTTETVETPQTTGAPPTSAPTTTTSTPAPTATSAPPTTTTTTMPQTTTTAPPQQTPWELYLLNPGSGNTGSSATLPFGSGSAPSGPLANFDTDRDDDPGLLIKKDGAGLSGTDRTKVQEWAWSASSTTFSGEGQLTIWLAAKDFKTDERIGFLAAVDICDPGCSRLGTAQWSGSGSSTFRQATVSFGAIETPVSDGATVRLKLVVPDGLATTDVWFAFDAGPYPSQLRIG